MALAPKPRRFWAVREAVLIGVLGRLVSSTQRDPMGVITNLLPPG